MTAARTTKHDADRWLQARVDLIVATLPLTAVLNPVWAGLTIVPLGGVFPEFGVIPLPTLAAVVGMHLLNSVLATAFYLWAKRTKVGVRRVFAAFLVLQLWVSLTWGAGVLLSWEEGNSTNNTFLALLFIGMTWALAMTRSVHMLLLATGTIPMIVMFWWRAATGSSEAAEVFTVFTPIFTAYAWFMAVSARDRVNQLLKTRFDLEDMAKALEIARSEAVAKSAEAEAASASKSAFVANMSHELRTPLNAILGFAEVIERCAVGGEVPPQYRAYAGDIRESGSHLLSLINDMLDVAKIEAGKMELDPGTLDAKAVVDSAVRLVANRAEAKGQTIDVAIDKDVLLQADERAFKQILINLLSNAVKFSPDGGKIVVRCTRSGEGSALVVEDCGPGIPDENIKQLFRPFSQVDNRYDRNAGGTGLGLALIKGLIALHGGTVRVENMTQGGLRAIVEFPARRKAAAA